MNQQEAKKLAEKIKAIWAAKGVHVTPRLVSEPLTPAEARRFGNQVRNVWGVRTDLKNGLPRPKRGLPMIRRKELPQ